MRKTETNFIVRTAWARTRKQNKNYIIIICGQTGSGKSWLALRLAEMIDEDFNMENVFFEPEKLFSILAENRPPKGSVIIFDEAGLGIGSRDWRSEINKATSKIIQLFRFENLVLIMTVPGLGFMDSQVRKLIHAYIEPSWIDYKKQLTWFKFHTFQYNPRLDKIYYHRKGGVDFHCIGRPGQEIIDEYEAKKREFADEFYAKQNKNFGEREKNIRIAKEIDALDITAEEKYKKFEETTGKTSRTFRNYKKI